MYSLLHCHFESALRALSIANPERIRSLRKVYASQEYRQSSPAGRLTQLWQTVLTLTDDEEIFTEAMFRQVVRGLLEEMRASRVEHLDLRIGPSTGRWRWMRGAEDGIDIFREELARQVELSVSFLAGINMTKTEGQLDAIFDVLSESDEVSSRIAGVDLNFLDADVPKFDRYLSTLRSLQNAGLKVNIHLGELFGNEISQYVLTRITPDRIGHGVLLLQDCDMVEIIKSQQICLDMCPTSNTLLGVVDWHEESPASYALQLGIPVSINTDDPLLFGTDISREFRLSGLTEHQQEEIIANSREYRYGPS